MPSEDQFTQRDIVHGIPKIRFRLPRTKRELFAILSYITPDRDIDGLVDLVDFTDATPAAICNAVFGRSPGNADEAIPGPDYDPREQFRAALLSDEFRRSTMPWFLAAFEEKGRDIFIHVPKCAGTDLILSLAARALPLPKMLEVKGWVSDREFLQAVGGLARAAPFHERVFVYGHMELGDYVATCGIRPIDRVFTVIRDPLDLMLSQANYAIGRLRQDPTGRDPDTAETLEYLDIASLPEEISSRDLKDLTSRALLNPNIASPNRACTYLGRGMKGLYATAMERLVVHDVEITTTKYYDRWLLERWGIGRSQRHNRSETILTRNELRWLYADELRSATAEDQKLYDVVSWALAQTGTSSVTGMEIARLAGSWLMDGVPPPAPPPAPSTPPKPLILAAREVAAEPDLLAAEEPDGVNLHLQAARAASPGGPRSEILLSVKFGVDGKGKDYQLDGWSVTEKTFTWTNAPESRLQLPPFPPHGLCVLRLIGNPYVSAERVPFQRIELSVNGEPLGAARIRDISVIECEVPRRLLGDDVPIDVTLRFPNAAIPRKIDGVSDGRLLAFALHEVVVLQIHPAAAPE